MVQRIANALEDMYGFATTEVDGHVQLKLSTANAKAFFELYPCMTAWHEQKVKLENGEISKEEYDCWRYQFPKHDASREWVTVPSEFISSIFTEGKGKK